jgi:hypothetical protein
VYAAPDPVPHTGSAPIIYEAYDYWTPAEDAKTHVPLLSESFKCHVSVNGKRFCILYKQV